MPRILHLTLHRQWFDDIAVGIKKNEYREVKPYWTRRLVGRTYDEIHFRNGYHKDAPFMRVEYIGMTKAADLYVIRLGFVLEIKNWTGRRG